MTNKCSGGTGFMLSMGSAPPYALLMTDEEQDNFIKKI